MISRVIITTEEGTKTIRIPEWNECYHSHHGVLQEAEHVFITYGMDLIDKEEISVLEIGFGTGLNAFLTLHRAIEKKKRVHYYTLEKYPVNHKELIQLEYWKLIEKEESERLYFALHEAEWGKPVKINDFFYITKYEADFFSLKELPVPKVNLVYYDAFGARVQPELWEEEIFEQIYNKMLEGALLTTYSSKGSARRAMQKAGLEIEKKAGPKGKREMVNAWRR